MLERLFILRHFAATRWGPQPRDRQALLARQQKKLRRFLARVKRRSPFYQNLTDDAFPILDKAAFLANFTDLNPHRVTLADATALALAAERDRDFKPQLPGGLTVGLSSGTSGARHVFLVSRADRCRWAGRMLARTLTPDSLRRILNPFAAPLRIAFFLRANSNLYTTLASRRIRLAYFDLTRPFESLLDELRALDPAVIVAPATVLAEIARREKTTPSGLRPRQVVSVAEVLDPRDRAEIESAFSIRVAEVYQAAEGFLGATCEAGHLHLNEEDLHIEPQWLDDRKERFHPLITDFSRRSQWFVRYHLQDILRVRRDPCPCGRPSLCLESVDGRAEEILWLPDHRGTLSPVFPDSLRQALYTIGSGLDLYRIGQHGMRWEIRLRHGTPALEAEVRTALTHLLDKLQLQQPAFDFPPWTDQPPAEKQKRIRCLARPA